MDKKVAFKRSPFQGGAASNVSFVIGAESANVINVGLQFQDNGEDVGEKVACRAYLSDDADGNSVVATAPTSVAIGTDGVAIPLVAGKCFELISEDDGDLDLDITLSSGGATYYLAVILPDGRVTVSDAITFAA